MRAEFLKNQWYVGALSSELQPGPVGRKICGESVAMFRRTDGTIAAIGDICPHRKFSLSKGKLFGDEIRCGYHGIRYDGAGRCTSIPFQATIPQGFGVKAYPTIEKHKFVFVWIGDPARADATLVPQFPENDSPDWVQYTDYIYIRANYQICVDNVLDLTHTPIAHSTLGGFSVMDFPLEVETSGDLVQATRVMNNSEPGPLAKVLNPGVDQVDQITIIEYTPPVSVHIMFESGPSGANQLLRTHTVALLSTPETEKTTHYFWSSAVNRAFHRPEDPDALERMNQRVIKSEKIAFAEDVVLLETQQRMMEEDPTPLANLSGDKASVAARRIMARKLSEQGSAAAAE